MINYRTRKIACCANRLALGESGSLMTSADDSRRRRKIGTEGLSVYGVPLPISLTIRRARPTTADLHSASHSFGLDLGLRIITESRQDALRIFAIHLDSDDSGEP